jgi:hypothetical protein
MRKIRRITGGEEGFRLEQYGSFMVPRRNPVELEPAGTIVLLPFKVAGYDEDCDGSLMARLDNITMEGEKTGWSPNHIGLRDGVVVTLDELKRLTSSGKSERRMKPC